MTSLSGLSYAHVCFALFGGDRAGSGSEADFIGGICCTRVVAGGRGTDEEIKQRVTQESIASYPGNCPCPYSHAANGSKCGKRSAWSKAGGYSPICYPDEVTPQMVEAYRVSHGG